MCIRDSRGSAGLRHGVRLRHVLRRGHQGRSGERQRGGRADDCLLYTSLRPGAGAARGGDAQLQEQQGENPRRQDVYKRQSSISSG